MRSAATTNITAPVRPRRRWENACRTSLTGALIALAAAAIGSQRLEYGTGVAADWYTLFGSEAVNYLVQEALHANPHLEAARHNLRAAQYELEAVAGTALAQVELSARASRAKVTGSLL